MGDNKTEGTITLLSTKMAKIDKTAYTNACNDRGVVASVVTRKLISKWMAGEIKLEI